VLFDMDGVIVDSIPTHVKAWVHVFRLHGVELDPLLPRLREGEKAHESCAVFCRQYGLPSDPETCATMVEEKRRHFRSLPQPGLQAGFADVLVELGLLGVSAAVVTGSTQDNLEHLLSPELLARFGAVVCAEDYTRGKPDPEPYRVAAARLGQPAERCLVVENAPLGIRSARAAGCYVLGLATTLGAEHLDEAHEVAADFGRVLELTS
jgi:beta-phosphoglucomutase